MQRILSEITTLAKHLHAETRNQPYLTKLRLTKNVRRLVTRLFAHPDWEKAGLGWQGREDTLQLSGWSRPRRVIVLRRQIKGDVLIASPDDPHMTLAFIESKATAAAYEYAVLVTSTDYEILTVAQLYRGRADAENNFDELKISGGGAASPPTISNAVVSWPAWWRSSTIGGTSSCGSPIPTNITRRSPVDHSYSTGSPPRPNTAARPRSPSQASMRNRRRFKPC